MTANEAFAAYVDLILFSSSPRAQNTEIGRWKNHLAPIIGTCELESINPYKILLLEKALKSKSQLSPQSIYHCLSLLRRVLKRAVEWEFFPGPVPKFRMPKFDNRRIRFLSTEEAENLLTTIRPRSEVWYDIALFALSTGLRRGEILSLTPPQISLNTKTCSILDSKSFRGRAIPLNPAAFSIAQKYLGKRTPLLFTEKGRSVNPYSKHFHNAVKACGLNHGVADRRAQICFHSLRHTFASWLVQAGTPLSLVGQLLGHTSQKMTLRYAHLSPEQGQNAVLNLPLAHFQI